MKSPAREGDSDPRTGGSPPSAGAVTSRSARAVGAHVPDATSDVRQDGAPAPHGGTGWDRGGGSDGGGDDLRQDGREVAAVLVALAGLRRGEALHVVSAPGRWSTARCAAAAGPGRRRARARRRRRRRAATSRVAAARPAPRRARSWRSRADRGRRRPAARAAGAALLRVVALPGGVAWLGRREA